MGQFVFLNENNVAQMSSDCKATLLIQVNLHLLNYITVHERITVLACGDIRGQMDSSWWELKSDLLASVWTQSDFKRNENI